MTGHVHAELMAQYAEDARTHAEPWRLWEYWAPEDRVWTHLSMPPHWNPEVEYQRKPVAPGEEEMTGHVHAELMAQYAEDARTHAEPWRLWECKAPGDRVWTHLSMPPHWNPEVEYQRKPVTGGLQEPTEAEQAAWQAGLDEGRRQGRQRSKRAEQLMGEALSNISLILANTNRKLEELWHDNP